MNYLRDARLKLGINQTEAAYLLGTSEAVVYRWEGGKHKPLHRYYKKLIEIYKLDRLEFYAWLEGEEVSEYAESA